MSDNFVNYSNITALMTAIGNKIKNIRHNFNDDDFVVENNEVSLVSAQRIFTGTQAEWDALTLADKQTYGQVNITDDDSTANYEVYSTEETKTNKVWVDGKPIYRKVFYTDNWVDTSTYDATALNIDEVTSLKTMWLREGSWFEAPFLSQGGFFTTVWYTISSKMIVFQGSSTHAGAKNRTIIEYTKTTD